MGKNDWVFALCVIALAAVICVTKMHEIDNKTKWLDIYTTEAEDSFGVQVLEARIESPALIIVVNITDFHHFIDELDPDVIYKAYRIMGWAETYYVFNDDMTIAYEYTMRLNDQPKPWGR